MSGYMLYAAATFKLVFDHQPDDVYWCTADIGWITGHSYITYGPLANGATSVLVSATDVVTSCFLFPSSVVTKSDGVYRAFDFSLRACRRTRTSAVCGRSWTNIM